MGCVFVEGDQMVGRGCNRTVVKRNVRRQDFATFTLWLIRFDRAHGTQNWRPSTQCRRQVSHPSDLPTLTSTSLSSRASCVQQHCSSLVRAIKDDHSPSAGIRKVYYGAGNDKFGGCGSVFRLHTERTIDNRRHGYAVQAGVCQAQAVELLKQFYAVVRHLGSIVCTNRSVRSNSCAGKPQGYTLQSPQMISHGTQPPSRIAKPSHLGEHTSCSRM